MPIALTLASTLIFSVPTPIFQLSPDGSLPAGRYGSETAAVQTPYGIGVAFSGSHSGISVTDQPMFGLTHSLTLSSWIYLDAYTNQDNSSPGAQIIFRGDDRSGCDPYHLTVGADGTVGFGIEDAFGHGAGINAPVDLHTWVHVVGSLDDRDGSMRLFLNNRLVAQTVTRLRPAGSLDSNWLPGIGIGNVQASYMGRHNQPLHGKIVDVRIYNAVVAPVDAGYPARPFFRE